MVGLWINDKVGCGSHAEHFTQFLVYEDAKTISYSRWEGYCMAKIALDVLEEFMGLVDTWRKTLESMISVKDRTCGGKAVDFREVERKTSNGCRESEREAPRVSPAGIGYRSTNG